MTEEKKGICESVVEYAIANLLVENHQRPSEKELRTLKRLAEKIDAHAAHAGENAKWLAERLARFAADCEIGVVSETTPLRSSAADEIESSAAKYVAQREVFEEYFVQIVGFNFNAVRRDWRAS